MRVKQADGTVADYRTVWMEDDVVMLIEQRELPFKFELFEAKRPEQVAYAIREMVVRGAPAIGATAAYGLAQGILQGGEPDKVAELIRSTRPTAQDLFHATAQIMEAIEPTLASGAQVAELGQVAMAAAQAYADDNAERCRLIGVNGAPLLEEGTRVLTHCNAGALATVDFGTALSPMREAHQQGRNIHVWVDETRPRLQGAQLTAWELYQEGIDHTLIADNAAGYYMAKGEVDLVITGTDRVAPNGDFANKIGTYEKAVVAHELGIPFYVAMPVSTVDFSIEKGGDIPIEERAAEEVTVARGTELANPGSPVGNPAFDVTPRKYVAGFITERGILKPPLRPEDLA